MKNFENMTIGELRKLHKQVMEQNLGFKTALELLEEKQEKARKKLKYTTKHKF